MDLNAKNSYLETLDDNNQIHFNKNFMKNAF